jgi:hypothetical protein
MGYAWQEVPFASQPVDIAYTAEPAAATGARLVVQATPAYWQQRRDLSLAQVGRYEGWAYPLYRGETGGPPLLSYESGRVICTRDLIFDSFWLLTGQEEQQRPKNKHGYVDWSGTATEQTGALRLALASAIGSSMEQLLGSMGYRERLPRWPGNRRAAAATSHDVDYPEVVRWLEPLRILARQKQHGLAAAWAVARGTRHHWHFRSWMELEQRLGTRSAFYFVARKGSLVEYATHTPDTFYDIHSPRFRQLFRELAAGGFEIGLHASYHAHCDEAMFAAEKAALEAACGQPVVGNRHHYWHLDPVNPEATLHLHERLGLAYDASLTNDRYLGWRRGMVWPFFPFHQGLRRQLHTLQLPTGWMDDQLFGHRAHNPGNRQALLQGLANRTAEQGGCLLVDIHDYVFDDALFPGWAAAYRELWEYLVSRGDFWLATPGEIAAHWQNRYNTLLQQSLGLDMQEHTNAHLRFRPAVHLPAAM